MHLFSEVFYIYRYVLVNYYPKVLLIAGFSVLAQFALLMSLLLPWQILQVLATGHSRLDDSFIELIDLRLYGLNSLSNISSPIGMLLLLSALTILSFLSYLSLLRFNKSQIKILAEQCVEDNNKTKLY